MLDATLFFSNDQFFDGMSVVVLKYKHRSWSGKITFRDDEGIFDQREEIIEAMLEALRWVAIEATLKS